MGLGHPARAQPLWDELGLRGGHPGYLSLMADRVLFQLPVDAAGFFLSHRRAPRESTPGNQKGWAGLWNYKGSSLVCWRLLLSADFCHVTVSELQARWSALTNHPNPTNVELYLS